MGPAALVRHNVHVVGNAASGRWLVCVHGFGTDQTAWQGVIAPFLADYRIVLLDNAGAGGASPDAFAQHRYLGLHQYAADVIEVCVTLGVRDATLIGHSVGGMIGVLAAIDRPDLFVRLVLVAASPHYLDEPGYRGGFSEADLTALYGHMASSYEEWTDGFAALTHPDTPEQARIFASCLKTIPADRALTVLCSIFQSDHRADVGRVRQPTLIIQAAQDVAVPMDVARYLERAIVHSQLHVVQVRGHLPHVTQPGLVSHAIRSFLDTSADDVADPRPDDPVRELTTPY